MGYLHIDNLYKIPQILEFKTLYALEKIHGSSANIRWNKGRVALFEGGVNKKHFESLFDLGQLTDCFKRKFTDDDHVIIYGEVYGGKHQKMSKTYGDHLRFTVFDVMINDAWLSVPQAVDTVLLNFPLLFVPYATIPCDMESIDHQRDTRSIIAMQCGIVEDRIREGIVLRPPFECALSNGKRVIAKYKRAEFSERGTPNVETDPTKRQITENAQSIAAEWVTNMRLEHVIGRLTAEREDKEVTVKDTGSVIALMVEDVTREASGEIVDNAVVRREIGSSTAKLFKKRLAQGINEAEEAEPEGQRSREV